MVYSTKRNRLYIRIEPEVRFMAKVQKADNGCWIWTAAKDVKGYGRFARVDGVKQELAHRASYIMFRGPIPDGMFICHTCDTPGCVNPDHLFPGTAAQNTADMVSKWRTRTKLTREQVVEIKSSKEACTKLAARFGMDKASILNIRHGRTFAEVSV